MTHENQTLNGWEIIEDRQRNTQVKNVDSFVAKRKFPTHDGYNMGLSLYAKKRFEDSYEIEIAIEKEVSKDKMSVIATLRLDNAATEKEALERVRKITEGI
jgi:hypothetical protein